MGEGKSTILRFAEVMLRQGHQLILAPPLENHGRKRGLLSYRSNLAEQLAFRMLLSGCSRAPSKFVCFLNSSLSVY
jgi:hypothetical protein